MKTTRRGFIFSASAALLLPEAFGSGAIPFGAGARVPDLRIQRLLALALDHDVQPPPVAVAYDPADEELPEPVRIGKRLKEYISAQPVTLRADEEFVGWLTFDDSVENDLYPRRGHRAFAKAAFSANGYYCKPQDAIATFEWQHSSINYAKLLKCGLSGLRADIAAAKVRWAGNRERLDYLQGLALALDGLETRARNCAAECRRQAAAERDAARRTKLLEMAARCERVPMNPATSFLDAVQTIYFCFDCLMDAIGRTDQYLAPYYFVDIAKGVLTREQAEAALQELFIYIDAHTPHHSVNYDRGGECHMTVGGLTPDGRDGWTDFSRLLVESLLALDLKRPQMSFRWHPGTQRETLRYILDCERKDPNQRIAFDGDLPRIEAFTKRFGMPVELARDYCMTGCNETTFSGGISLGGCKWNVLRTMTSLFEKRRKELLACATWVDFCAVFERQLGEEFDELVKLFDRFNELRAADCNVLSALFIDGCIENAESPTRGGAKLADALVLMIGEPNLIDSLCIVRQFVFAERRCTMQELADAIAANWQGFDKLHAEIVSEGRFFGANDAFTNETARYMHLALGRIVAGRRDRFGNLFDFGNLAGYNDHGALFGRVTGATPDGRRAGEDMSFGSGPAMHHGTDAATSALLAVARADPEHINCGGGIMNLSLPASTVSDDNEFEKVVLLVETYFSEGGMHLQLNHVSRETLIDAQQHPEKYPTLRVRVSGFSGYFVRMKKTTQDEIIARMVVRP